MNVFVGVNVPPTAKWLGISVHRLNVTSSHFYHSQPLSLSVCRLLCLFSTVTCRVFAVHTEFPISVH